MAVFQTGMTGAIKGSVGGLTYTTNKGRHVCKRRSYPVRRHVGTQSLIRATLGWVTRQWGLAGAAIWAEWTAYAQSHLLPDKFGQPSQVSGFNWYVKLNMEQMIAADGVEIVCESPPVADPIFTVNSIVASDGLADGTVVLTPALNGAGDADDFLQIQVAGPFTSEGKQIVDSFFTDMASAAGNAATVDVTDLQVLAWYHFRARYTTLANRASNWVYTQWQAPEVV